jgi:uncharacterized protein YihD (DUF1040 family)
MNDLDVFDMLQEAYAAEEQGDLEKLAELLNHLVLYAYLMDESAEEYPNRI